MANVFLSYDREDHNRAKAVAEALENLGHAVWWDRHIKGGAQYSDEIEEALKRADAVVVLWSPASVRSAWVRDEAAAGRDSGRLVPILIKPVDPPMGFRQYQTIDLTRWRGKADARPMTELHEAVDAFGKPDANTRPALSKTTSATGGLLPRGALVALAVLALFLVSFLGWKYGIAAKGVPSVSVAASDKSPASAALSRDLFVKLGMLQTAGDERMQLIEAKDAKDGKTDLLFEVGATANSAASANLVLLAGGNRALLWSKDFNLPEDRKADLKEQTAYTAAQVLGCALESRQARISANDRLTKLYLEGCSILAEFTGIFVRPALPAFLEVTRKAPEFEEGWSKLLLTEAQMVTASHGAEKDQLLKSLKEHIANVQTRFPDNAAAMYAEGELLPISATRQRLALSEAAVRQHPGHPFLLQQRSLLLFRVGRIAEAVDKASAAAEADPLSSKMRGDYIAVLAYAGLIDRAKQELEKGERLWPGSFAMVDAASRIDARFGDPKKALAVERSGIFGNDIVMEAFLLARIDPSPANIERAIAANMKMFGRDPRALGFLMQAYGAFGMEEQLFAFFDRWRGELPVSSAGVLFRKPLSKFRRDPRFMQVADRFGLIAIWQDSGKWPDFCFEADLPYDCKREAEGVRG